MLQTIATGLDAWQEPAIAAATIGDSQISPQRLLAGPNTLYLIAPAHDQRRLRGLFTALVADITAAAFDRSAQTGRPINPPLLLALDEAANIAPLPNLDEIASTGPGQGVQLLTILQNISQASDRWGKDRAETIIANHRARLFCSGIGDRATLDYLSHTLGEEEINRISTHRQSPLATGSRTYQQRVPQRSPHPTASAKPTPTPPCWSTDASSPPGSTCAPGTPTANYANSSAGTPATADSQHAPGAARRALTRAATAARGRARIR